MFLNSENHDENLVKKIGRLKMLSNITLHNSEIGNGLTY